MIIVKISGGLGNQLFQFAMLYALQKKYPNTVVKADVASYKLYNDHYGLELDKVFGLVERGILPLASIKEQCIVRGEIPLLCDGKIGEIMEIPIAWFNARTRKYYQKKGMRNDIHEENFLKQYMTYDIGIEQLLNKIQNLDVSKNWYIDGYWQNEKFFDPYLTELRQILIFPSIYDEKNMQLIEDMRTSNSVAVHIRRGDYVGSAYDILTMKYYRKAIEYIEQYVNNPYFYFFSEDETYAEQKFAWVTSKKIVTHNRGNKSFRDLELMSNCKHNIVANSSFSVWAGFLNRNPQKIVIYPSMYKNNERNIKKYEKGWIMLEA